MGRRTTTGTAPHASCVNLTTWDKILCTRFVAVQTFAGTFVGTILTFMFLSIIVFPSRTVDWNSANSIIASAVTPVLTCVFSPLCLPVVLLDANLDRSVGVLPDWRTRWFPLFRTDGIFRHAMVRNAATGFLFALFVTPSMIVTFYVLESVSALVFIVLVCAFVVVMTAAIVPLSILSFMTVTNHSRMIKVLPKLAPGGGTLLCYANRLRRVHRL